MIKEINPFKVINQFLVETGDEKIVFDTMEEVNDFKSNFEDDDEFKITPRTLNGKQYNDWLIGSRWGDSSEIIDEDCPKCGHLLAKDTQYDVGHEDREYKFCTDHECGFTTYQEREPIHVEHPKFREVGQTAEQFCKKHKFSDQSINDLKICTACKQEMTIDDFYTSDGNAWLTFKHKEDNGCTNKGGAIITPFSEKQKNFWGNILG